MDGYLFIYKKILFYTGIYTKYEFLKVVLSIYAHLYLFFILEKPTDLDLHCLSLSK